MIADTCDAVRAEFDAAPAYIEPLDLPMRARIHQMAKNPTTSGRGRSAALGVSVVLTVSPQRSGAGRIIVLVVEPPLWPQIPAFGTSRLQEWWSEGATRI